MPRIRTIKPEFWSDEDLAKLPLETRLLFIGIWNLSDDYGICKRNPKWIKAQLFPYDENLVTEDSISAGIEALIREKMLFFFSIDNEGFIIVLNFSRHQKIDRPSFHGHIAPDKYAKFLGLNIIPKTFSEYSSSLRLLLVAGKERKGKGKEREKDAFVDYVPGAPKDLIDTKTEYKSLIKSKASVIDFVKKNKPLFIEPYFDLWNYFAGERKLPKISTVNASRERQFAIRIREKNFDFIAILAIAKDSEFLVKGNWFTFDWIIKSEANYTKVLDGNYKQKNQEKNGLNGSQQSSREGTKLAATVAELQAGKE